MALREGSLMTASLLVLKCARGMSVPDCRSGSNKLTSIRFFHNFSFECAPMLRIASHWNKLADRQEN
ncbi:hypothetical protein Ciccas_002169 [Cichlidogyrus casuarinus]|uniref:Secreted protein n=1 Tax=Cichlidogyrus casuarinus TaxID=1844966 RepID=A0ABD2QI08_9PLAT